MGDRSRDRRRRGALASRLLWCRRRLRQLVWMPPQGPGRPPTSNGMRRVVINRISILNLGQAPTDPRRVASGEPPARRSTHRVLEFNKIGPRLRRALHLWIDARMGSRKRPISTVTSPSKDMRNCGRCSAAHHAASRAQSLQHVLQEDGDTARPQGRDRGRSASDLSDRRALWLEHSTASKFLN
jgi:hypothetical protein